MPETEKSYILLTGNKQSTRSFQEFIDYWNQHDSWIHNLYDRVNKLEEKVSKLEQPIRFSEIIAFLEKEGQPRTGNYISRHLSILWSDIRDLEATGKIKVEYHGKRKMYVLTKTEEPIV